MRGTLKYGMILLVWMVYSTLVSGQSTSSNQVKYMVTRDSLTQVYTAWVVPSYDLPNANNADVVERGATAQFSIKVPTGFVITSLSDIRGVWEKSPTKIGWQAVFAKADIPQGLEYYIIGKSNTETNYGEFKKNAPVALFRFTGRGADGSKVGVLENDDKFVRIAHEQFSLNVSSSFYSRSGQSSDLLAKPLEQFVQPTSLKTVLATTAGALSVPQEAAGDYKIVAYPNPVQDTLHLKYFVEKLDQSEIKLEIVDVKGVVLKTVNQKAVLGYNSSQIPMTNTVDGLYYIRTYFDNKVQNVKVIKFQ